LDFRSVVDYQRKMAKGYRSVHAVIASPSPNKIVTGVARILGTERNIRREYWLRHGDEELQAKLQSEFKSRGSKKKVVAVKLTDDNHHLIEVSRVKHGDAQRISNFLAESDVRILHSAIEDAAQITKFAENFLRASGKACFDSRQCPHNMVCIRRMCRE